MDEEEDLVVNGRDEQGLFVAGISGNAEGRPPTKNGKSKPISALRRTLTKLRKLEGLSLQNIEKSIKGEEIDKETLTTSKWLVNTLGTMHKSAVSEEKDLLNIREFLEGGGSLEEEIEPEELSWTPPFSTRRLTEAELELTRKEEVD